MKSIKYDTSPFRTNQEIKDEQDLTTALARWLQAHSEQIVERDEDETATMVTFGHFIKGLRRRMGLDRPTLAWNANLDPIYLSLLENGMLTPRDVPPAVAYALARELDRPLKQWPSLPWPLSPASRPENEAGKVKLGLTWLRRLISPQPLASAPAARGLGAEEIKRQLQEGTSVEVSGEQELPRMVLEWRGEKVVFKYGLVRKVKEQDGSWKYTVEGDLVREGSDEAMRGLWVGVALDREYWAEEASDEFGGVIISNIPLPALDRLALDGTASILLSDHKPVG